MSISNVIKELRLKKEITQEELAKKLNISTQAVSKWENGGSPDIDMIPAIAEYFDVSIDYLFERKKIYSKDVEKVIFKYLYSPLRRTGSKRRGLWKYFGKIKRRA